MAIFADAMISLISLSTLIQHSMKANSSQNHSDKNTIIMKTILFIFLLLPALILLFNACKTDFDATSDYKEIAIVYGVLNQKDNVHYLRVNKAFLGQGNAVIYSQIPDSSSYGNDIEVFINELKGTPAHPENILLIL